MASLKATVGTFFNRKFDKNGMATKEKIPFLPKTLAKLVFMTDGESVEHAMKAHCNELESISNKVTELETGNTGVAGTKSFENMDAYLNALKDGSANPNAIYVVKD